jgi:hypothetical protein
MRNAILISILTAVLVAGSVAVYAGPPANGTYQSLNGDFDNGREASSWAPGGGGYLGVGNVLHAESWDGATFGVDWQILCPQVVNTFLVLDMLDANGNGQQIWQITYAGGTVVLGGTGPWAGGDAQYTGIIDTYSEFRTVQFQNFAVVGAVSNHAVSAHLQGYTASCMTWGIGNGAWLGMSPNAKPADFPDYRDANCSAGPTEGHWGNFTDLTISVQGCAVSTEQSTWGAVKSLYR